MALKRGNFQGKSCFSTPSIVRCPGDTNHFRYQKYIQLILLLSERQISTEKVKQSESWTPYRL